MIDIKKKENKIKKEFFNFLFNGNDYIHFLLLPENKKSNSYAQQYYCTYKNLEKNIEIAKQNKQMIAYTPNLFSNQRKKEFIKSLNTIFIDIDKNGLKGYEQLKKLNLKPNFVFKKDDDHYHIYFKLKRIDKPTILEINKYELIEKKLIEITGGDKAVHDITRVMRVPYTINFKDNLNKYYYLEEKNLEKSYSLDYLFNVLEIDSLQLNKKNKFIDVFRKKSIEKETIVKFLKNNYKNDKKISQGDGRSLRLYQIGCDCFKWGLEKNEAIEIAQWYNENFFIPNEKLRIVKHQILSAYKYVRSDFGVLQNDYVNSTNDKQAQKVFNNFKHQLNVREALKNYCYALYQDKIIEMTTDKEFIKSNTFDRLIATKAKTNMGLKEILANDLIRTVDTVEFDPTSNLKIYKKGKQTFYNTYKQPKIYNEEIEKDENYYKAIGIFLKHIKYLSHSKIEYEIILKYLAFLIQNPGRKISYALLICSKHHGVGKSLLELLFKKIFDSEYITSIQNTQLNQNWNEFMLGNLIAFIHELYQGDNHKTANYFKTLITEPKISLVMRYTNSIQIKNTVNFVMFTNHINAIRTDEYDRRLAVIYHDKKPQEQQYYNQLVDTIEKDYIYIFKFLFNYDLSNFNPNMRPELTRGHKIMIEQSKSELDIFYEDLLENKEGPFSKNIFTVDELVQYAKIQGDLKNKATPNSTVRFLRSQGFDTERISKQYKGKRKQKRIWFKKPFNIKKLKENELLKLLNFENIDDQF